MKSCLRIFLALAIVAATGLGYAVYQNFWMARFHLAARDAGYDPATFEGLSAAISDPRIDVPNYSVAVLFTGGIALLILFSLSGNR